MKKLLALAGIALIAAACTNNDEPVQECGQINLTLENSTAPEIEVSTRTVTDLTETDAKDDNIQVLQNGNVKLESTNFLTFKNTTFIFPIGSGYTVTAESCTEEVGQSANDGVGQIRYFGTSAPFEVPGSRTPWCPRRRSTPTCPWMPRGILSNESGGKMGAKLLFNSTKISG